MYKVGAIETKVVGKDGDRQMQNLDAVVKEAVSAYAELRGMEPKEVARLAMVEGSTVQKHILMMLVAAA